MSSSHLPLVINRDNTSKRLFQFILHQRYSKTIPFSLTFNNFMECISSVDAENKSSFMYQEKEILQVLS